jgi:Tfp pilus assembly protein PilF
MKPLIILILIALLILSTSCSLHKEPAAAGISKDCEYYLGQASFYLTKGDADKAIANLKEALALSPDSSKAHNLLGIAYFQKRDYGLARDEYKRAIELDRSYAQAYNNLGTAFFMLKEFGKAEQMFKKALSLFPNLVSAHFGLGTLLAAQGKIEESTYYFTKGIELDPEFLEREKAFVADFSSDTFNNPEIFYAYAKVYANMGNLEKAVLYLNKAKRAGFKDWHRIEKEKEFEMIREDERIKSFIRS